MIPETFPTIDTGDYAKDMMDSYYQRREWTKKGMFAFVSQDWTKPLAKWIGTRKCLEVMAGAGWLAKALKDEGVDIIASDNHTWGRKQEWVLVTDVIEEDATISVTNHGEFRDILIMSWPYMDDHAYMAAKQMYIQNPKALILYIGETEGGCTANEKFFEHFEPILDPQFEQAVENFKSWDGIHDYPYLGKFKP